MPHYPLLPQYLVPNKSTLLPNGSTVWKLTFICYFQLFLRHLPRLLCLLFQYGLLQTKETIQEYMLYLALRFFLAPSIGKYFCLSLSFMALTFLKCTSLLLCKMLFWGLLDVLSLLKFRVCIFAKNKNIPCFLVDRHVGLSHD